MINFSAISSIQGSLYALVFALVRIRIPPSSSWNSTPRRSLTLLSAARRNSHLALHADIQDGRWRIGQMTHALALPSVPRVCMLNFLTDAMPPRYRHFSLHFLVVSATPAQNRQNITFMSSFAPVFHESSAERLSIKPSMVRQSLNWTCDSFIYS